jgi:phosphoserine aminotransferase
MKKYNFFAGPAVLPKPVLKKAKKAVKGFSGMGLSILEISHRSSQFVAVMNEAEATARELLGIPEEYAVLFLTGGASSQFFMTPLNILHPNQKAGYVDTGTWSSKAIKEAKRYGDIQVIASSKDKNYNYIPKNFTIDSDFSYVHLTSNNTISGTRYVTFPETSVPLVCDMSSDIFSRPIDVKKFDVIYAGAQKNMGPAGVTLVIVKKDILGKTGRDIPSMLDYQIHISKQSSFNTPPVFPIYVSMLTMKWIKKNGGVSAMEKRNEEKAANLYAEIDRNPLFYGTAEVEDRSLMNVCFLLKDNELEQSFLDMCEEAGCVGVKGHRSVGGFRASIYNALSLKAIDVLVEVMQAFEQKHG